MRVGTVFKAQKNVKQVIVMRIMERIRGVNVLIGDEGWKTEALTQRPPSATQGFAMLTYAKRLSCRTGYSFPQGLKEGAGKVVLVRKS
jgi:hypothetical protein